MRSFMRKVVHALEKGNDTELVSILTSNGSTPRGAGATLAVFPDGSTCGTVGGGNVEFQATQLARKLLADHQDLIQEARFVQGEAADCGMVCGGDVTLHFQYLSAEDAHAISVLRELLDATGRDADTWLIRRLEDSHVIEMGLADRNGVRGLESPLPDKLLQSKTVFEDGWFAIPMVRAGKVYIFGGGHVAQALVPAIAAVGFRPVVFDDRKEFASPELFPQAEKVLLGQFEQLEQQVKITPDDYVVIMTRGHQADYDVLTKVLRSGARYLGCIGSRKKLAICRDRLLQAGFAAEEYERVHAPIGLDIGAETPAEIAVSITAELIAVRAGK